MAGSLFLLFLVVVCGVEAWEQGHFGVFVGYVLITLATPPLTLYVVERADPSSPEPES